LGWVDAQPTGMQLFLSRTLIFEVKEAFMCIFEEKAILF